MSVLCILSNIFMSACCRCILGVLRNKICVLVTHQLQYLKDATSILCLQEVSGDRKLLFLIPNQD